eukprot:TRINITY_DN3039_c0_g2_i8.p3 TRINITY_DN3039_c0_g2~~TRINITY_DN3039_c0_g2_i8.p3  ORF type:complete len:139 (+),score=18.57 TRINITY_DN3039_c0_g2_i8:180-596(+)
MPANLHLEQQVTLESPGKPKLGRPLPHSYLGPFYVHHATRLALEAASGSGVTWEAKAGPTSASWKAKAGRTSATLALTISDIHHAVRLALRAASDFGVTWESESGTCLSALTDLIPPTSTPPFGLAIVSKIDHASFSQ